MNNRSYLSGAEANTILNQVSEPLLARGLGVPRFSGEASIIMLNPSDSDDIKIYERLHNEKENFNILSETDHAGKFTVFIVIRYVRMTDVSAGRSSAEELIEDYKKEKVKKKKASNKKTNAQHKKAKAAPVASKEVVVGFATGANP